MTMGECIRYHRKLHGLTQAELGMKLAPSVNRAAINKWETGIVENIRRSYIVQMAEMFGISPEELMCFDMPDKNQDSKSLSVLIREQMGEEGAALFEWFSKLNSLGRKKALENLEDMTAISKYTE